MEMNYASNGKANAGLTTGIIGTALGAMSVLGGGANLLRGVQGSAPPPAGVTPIVQGSEYVTKELMDVYGQLCDERTKNAILTSELNTEKKLVELEKANLARENAIRAELIGEIRTVDQKVDAGFSAQAVLNANVGSAVNLLQNQVNSLLGMTKTVIPNSSVCPGWGGVDVSIATASSTGTTAT